MQFVGLRFLRLRTVAVNFLQNANYETDLKMKKDGLRTNCTKYTHKCELISHLCFSARGTTKKSQQPNQHATATMMMATSSWQLSSLPHGYGLHTNNIAQGKYKSCASCSFPSERIASFHVVHLVCCIFCFDDTLQLEPDSLEHDSLSCFRLCNCDM